MKIISWNKTISFFYKDRLRYNKHFLFGRQFCFKTWGSGRPRDAFHAWWSVDSRTMVPVRGPCDLFDHQPAQAVEQSVDFPVIWDAMIWNNFCVRTYITINRIFTAASHKCHDVRNHRQIDCLFEGLYRLALKKTPEFTVTMHMAIASLYFAVVAFPFLSDPCDILT